MNGAGPPLLGFYDLRLVVLSIFVAISSSYAALDLGGRVTAARGWNRSAWLAGGATAMGLGIWSMHFTGMLAFSLPVPVAYHWPTVLLSLLIAMLASAVALYVVSRKQMGRHQAWTGSVLMGLGIVGMHYIGMAAMRLSATCHHNPLLVAVSVSIAILASLAALVFTFGYREDFRGTTVAKILSATAMGAGIFLMHYTGMLSAHFFPSTVLVDTSRAVSISSLGLNGIVIGTLTVLGAAILTSSVDRRFAIQAQELQTSERFRQIADNLRDVLSLSNADLSEVLFVNRAYEAIWGRTAESLYADPRSWLEGVHPDDRERVQEGMQRLAAGEPFDYLECRVVRPDGPIAWVRLRACPVVDAQGHFYRIVVTAHDFTKRKLAEERVKQAENRLRLVSDTTPAMIHSGRPDGYLDYFNQRWLEYVGLPLTDLQGWGWTAVIHPEDVDEYVDKWRARLASGEPFLHEARVRQADGEYRWMLFRKVPLRDEYGNIVKWYGSGTDIEDRKRAEDARREIEEQHRTVVETATDAVISIDEDGQILFVNPATTRIFGYESSELIGQQLTMLMPMFLRELYKADFQSYLATGEGHIAWHGVELLGLRKNREQFPVEVSFGEVVRQGHRVFTGFIQDVTDRVEAEDELRQFSGRLLRLQDGERWRIARELHDSTGQNLVALATMLGQLRPSIPSGARKARRLLSQSRALADRCIREVRTLSYELHPPVLDHAGLGNAIREYVDGFAKRSEIHVELDLSLNLGRMARDIELALFRVVQESLTNIQRHSGSQQARIRLDRTSDLTLEISDLGQGASAIVPRGKEDRRFKVGVGIPSMQERVKLIGGRLDIESGSQGTTIRVTIPLAGEPT